MAIIKKVEASLSRVPLNNVTSLSSRVVTNREYVLVKVTDDTGNSGIGFCYAGHRCGQLVQRAVIDLLAPVVLGQNSLRTTGLWTEMYREGLLHGRTGSVMRALSCIDIALWDLNARNVGLPLYQYMGADALDRVPAYASGGYYVEGKTPADLAGEVSDYVKAGFKAVKIKVGKFGVAEEAARVAAAREAIGPNIPLMLDANNAWTDLRTAEAHCKAYEPYHPEWIEEPFLPDDIDNHARLGRLTSIPIATGEIEAGRWRMKDLMDRDVISILQHDACVCGGITEWRRITDTAASYGITTNPHWFHDVHIHTVAASTSAQYVEFFVDSEVLNFRELIDTQLTFENGDVLLPQTPGLGFNFDEGQVEKYAAFEAGVSSVWDTAEA
ncbi:mandelate racemase/muconate lactonizing enzyme family protein [Shimia sp. R10_1]|uniref:mandelate racemase/muconate lactonizing enzyme family protein n=1 Tax=Shimia sp. R10_1 TaxID=2821095 RepID=UPI001ADBD0C4|nr:mandelate racemase/muconate lactonizing enzyme family protein [Shimia sp. R10_1]MBO9474005.1 mandelate racemase/muconate lactonizing enzyme family protein [Shimia sp. R10_1]